MAFFVGDRPLGEMTRPPFVARVESADIDPEAFVRVVATLRDGRERENVALLDEKVFVEHVDVRMVELQLVVTDRTGTAVGGLGVEDFEVIEGNQTRRPENLYPAERVGLLLGLAIDSSGSMWPLWDQTRSAARYFLDHTLRARDRAFLVDFDSELRLIEPPTADRQSLAWGLERLSPHGGTVLYDSILFSMLQYEGEHGRRALIVLTDGVDSESRSDPRRAIEFGRRLGVPVYVIALSGVPGGPRVGTRLAALERAHHRGAGGGGGAQPAPPDHRSDRRPPVPRGDGGADVARVRRDPGRAAPPVRPHLLHRAPARRGWRARGEGQARGPRGAQRGAARGRAVAPSS